MAKLAYVLLNFLLDNMFRTLHLGHHQVYRMFIRIQVNYCFCNVHLSLLYVTKTVVDLNTYEHPVDLMMTQMKGSKHVV